MQFPPLLMGLDDLPEFGLVSHYDDTLRTILDRNRTSMEPEEVTYLT